MSQSCNAFCTETGTLWQCYSPRSPDKPRQYAKLAKGVIILASQAITVTVKMQ